LEDYIMTTTDRGHNRLRDLAHARHALSVFCDALAHATRDIERDGDAIGDPDPALAGIYDDIGGHLTEIESLLDDIAEEMRGSRGSDRIEAE
jgi:hypothetical protein